MTPMLLGRIAVASVWLYEGLWCKLVGASRHQVDVVQAVPWIGARRASVLLRGIGAAECALAAWVLSTERPLAAAAVQTGLLAAMNGAGWIWARRVIPDPGGMIVKNFAFLVLAWIVAVPS